jgi:outer membrane lipoprotein-sorting protein
VIRRAVFFIVLCVAASGCASTPKSTLPTYPAMSAAASIEVMRARSAKLERVTGRGEITLESTDRGAVSLDSIFVLAPPDRARVRAYKFTQAVFDLTLNPDGLFIFVPRERGKPGELLESTRGAAGAIRQWLASFAGQVDAAGADVKQDARSITLTRPEGDGTTRTTVVDRPTLTVRQQTVRDSNGTVRFTLTLDDYRDFAGTLWPAKIVAVSERGTITLLTRELQPNVAADTAFTPPPRAVEAK